MSSENKSSGATALRSSKSESNAHAGMPSRWLARKLFDLAGEPQVRIRLWDGTDIGSDSPVATLLIHDRATLMRVLVHPDLYFGEAFMRGGVEVEGDLIRFLEAVSAARAQAGNRTLDRIAYGVLSRARSNTLTGSRDNIHHHYDLGNDFYRLWLDREAMQYTCAYYPHPEATLEQAQVAKLDHVCRKLQLKPGDKVVEAGCGWGGLARHMARHYGVTVRAYNISQEQVRFAREQAQAQGLDDRVEYVQDDYRNISGEYDVFVSVGMLEHVGTDHYAELSEVINGALKPNGRGLIHSIGRNRPKGPMNAWIERRIFPGAYPPSLGEMMGIFEHCNFSVLDVENLRLHYAQTLRHWLERYEANLEAVRRLFDESFVRAWRLYLAGSIASFATGHLQLFQVVFSRATNNEIPFTREHHFRDSRVQ